MKCTKCSNKIDIKLKKCLSCGTEVTDHDIFRYMNSYERVLELNPFEPYLARTSKRLLNYLIDFVFLWIFIAYSLFSDNSFNTLNLMFLFFIPAYFIIFEGYFGKTIGKYITGTTVLSRDGNPPTWKQVILKTISRLIPYEWISFLSIRKPIGWHDRLSKTIVVEDDLI